jgi:hypothetical protein
MQGIVQTLYIIWIIHHTLDNVALQVYSQHSVLWVEGARREFHIFFRSCEHDAGRCYVTVTQYVEIIISLGLSCPTIQSTVGKYEFLAHFTYFTTDHRKQ